MIRTLLLLIGLALLGLGVYWRWFERTASEKPAVTRLENALGRVRAGEGRLPVRIDSPPAGVRVFRTDVIRPGYAPCRPDAPAATDARRVALGCRLQLTGALQSGGWAIEAISRDNLGGSVLCARVVLFPIAADGQDVWFATAARSQSGERACTVPVRARFPIAIPVIQLQFRPIAETETEVLAEAEFAWNAQQRSGVLTRVEDLAVNQFWRDHTLDGLAEAIAASPAARRAGAQRVLVEGRPLGLPVPASLLLIETAEGLLSVAMNGGADPPAAPWVGVLDAPGMFEARLVHSMEFDRPLIASLQIGPIEALDGDVAETAIFSMGLGGALLLIAAALHGVVLARRHIGRS